MDNGDEKLALLERLDEALGDKQSVTLSDVKRLLGELKLSSQLDVDEAVDYLVAHGVTVIAPSEVAPREDALTMYFKDIGDATILDKSAEIEAARRMRGAIEEMQKMLSLTTLSISALLVKGTELEQGKIAVDDFTISSFRPADISPTEYRNDILLALRRMAITYDRLVAFITSSRRASIGTRTYWERKSRYRSQIDEEIEFIKPSFRIIESILPSLVKVRDFYRNAQKRLDDVLRLAGVSRKQAKELFEASGEDRLALAQKLGIGESTLDAVVAEYRRFDRVERRVRDVSLVPLPELFEQIERVDDLLDQYESDRELLVKANVRLVINIAKNYMNQGVEFLDLIQEGNHALLRAIERFDPDRGYKLSTYAIWWIRQAMIRCIAEQGQVIRLPAYLVQWARRYSRTVQELSQELGRSPTKEEVAEALGISVSELDEFLQALRGQVSLEKKLGQDEDSRSLLEVIEDESAESPSLAATLAVLQREIQKILSTLTPREAKVIALRFGLEDNYPRTLEEIGKMLGLSRERVRQIEAKALAKLRHPAKMRVLETFLKE